MFPTRYLLIFATFLLSLLLYVDRICISTAIVPIKHELSLSDLEFGWALSAFALGYALFQTPTGMLADRLGPRLVLAAVVIVWSVFTGLTGLAFGLTSLLIVRFLFGAGEAGAYPSIARAVYAWIPLAERGVAQSINFSGGRLGAAFALPTIAGLVERFGWRETFFLLMLIGFVWAVVWVVWFRDDPSQHSGLSEAERDLILTTRQQALSRAPSDPLSSASDLPQHSSSLVTGMFESPALWLLMLQYFASNFTFFFCLTWLFPFWKQKYELDSIKAGSYSAIPLVCGALGHIVAGFMVDRIYRMSYWRLSRALTASLGFILAAGGLIASLSASSIDGAVVCLAVAIFGSDMTISPSWAVCVDIGRKDAGAVSGTMNMAGNIGSFVTGLAFPYLLHKTGDVNNFFFVAAGLNLAAAVAWLFIRPDRAIRG